MNSLVLRQAMHMILTFLLLKSATTDQICANLVSAFKLKSLLLRILKTEKIGSIAAPHQPLKQCTCFLGHPVDLLRFSHIALYRVPSSRPEKQKYFCSCKRF